jgi:hypothetical protein
MSESLERELRALAATLEWPPTPDVATPALARIRANRAPRGLALRPRGPLAVAAA